MNKLAIAVTLCLAPLLAACPAPITSPGQIAQHTVADEQAYLRCLRGYRLTRTIGEMAADVPGLVTPARARQLLALDDRLFAIRESCRAAYTAFNSQDLIQAADQLDALSDQVQIILGRNPE